MGGKFQIFALCLCDRGGNIPGFAGRGDKVNGTVPQGFQVFVPVGEARGHDNGHLACGSPGNRENIAVGTVGEVALAKNKPDILFREEIVALVEARGVQRAPAVLLEDRGERAAVVEIRRND